MATIPDVVLARRASIARMQPQRSNRSSLRFRKDAKKGDGMRTIATALLVGALSLPNFAVADQARHAKHAKHPQLSRGIASVESKHPEEGQVSHGNASVYARRFVGRRTANGERLDMEHMTDRKSVV